MIDTRKDRPRAVFVVDDGGLGAMKAAAVAAVAIAMGGGEAFPMPDLRKPVLVDPMRRRSTPNGHYAPPREQGTREMARRKRQLERKAGGK